MKNLAIIPARRGSKGIKDKNIILLNEKPLMWYSIDSAIKSNCFDEIMVSTDSERYAEIAKQCGANVPFLRSKEHSSDFSSSWDVVQEVLNKYIEIGNKFDTVCLLQPTSPLRTSENIILAYEQLYKSKANAITSVCEVDHSPLWSMTLPKDYSLDEYRNKVESAPRQSLQKYYRINGAIYIRKICYMDSKCQILQNNEIAYIMERNRSIDIDTLDDLNYALFLLNNFAKESYYD